jgi:hypothetical protein
VFNRQQTKVKVVTFNSKGVKTLILVIDLVHILLSCYAKVRAS